MRRTNIFLLSIFFFFTKGYTQILLQAEDSESGIIEVIPQFYHIENNTSIPTWGEGLRQKIWYKNKMSIKEIRGFRSTTVNKIRTTVYPVQCYLFKYPPTGMIYEYRHFSDTAQALQSFGKTEYVNLVAGNIDYQDEQSPYLKSISEKNLPDTIIDQVNYKRAFLQREDSAGKPFYFLIHFRCDVKNKFLKFLDSTRVNSIRNDCPMVKFHAVASSENRLPLFSEEITFLADSLTNQEKKVFAAWERRAQEDARNK